MGRRVERRHHVLRRGLTLSPLRFQASTCSSGVSAFEVERGGVGVRMTESLAVARKLYSHVDFASDTLSRRRWQRGYYAIKLAR